MEMPMNAPEQVALNIWLKNHGHTAEEADDCLKFIAAFRIDPIRESDLNEEKGSRKA